MILSIWTDINFFTKKGRKSTGNVKYHQKISYMNYFKSTTLLSYALSLISKPHLSATELAKS